MSGGRGAATGDAGLGMSTSTGCLVDGGETGKPGEKSVGGTRRGFTGATRGNKRFHIRYKASVKFVYSSRQQVGCHICDQEVAGSTPNRGVAA